MLKMSDEVQGAWPGGAELSRDSCVDRWSALAIVAIVGVHRHPLCQSTVLSLSQPLREFEILNIDRHESGIIVVAINA